MEDFINKMKAAENYLKGNVKRVIGVESVKFIKENFRKEGFQDKSLKKWKEVERRKNPKTKGAAKSRKILSGETKQLQDSITFKVLPSGVNLLSDVPYAQIQNEGGKAGRNGSATIEARPFAGESRTLNKILKKEIDHDLNNLLDHA